MPGKPPLKETLLALYLLTTLPAAGERAASLGLTPGLLVYLALYLLLGGALVLGAYSASLAVRLVYAALLAGASLLLDGFARVTGQFLTYDTFITMIGSGGEADDAFLQYPGALAFAAGAALLLFAAVALPPRRRPPVPAAALAAAPLAASLLLGLLLFARGGEGGRALPGGFTGLAYGGLAAWERVSDDPGPRQPVKLVPRAAPAGRDIVFIVDESVAAAYLDIDNPQGVRSGLIKRRKDAAVYNFGYAASVTNCSLGSNQTLRYGGTRRDYRRINATMPSLFQYARRAGFHTVYVDAQRQDSRLNPFAPDELDGVDRVVSLGGTPVVERDLEAASVIARYLRDGRADFILVNKVGAHFPVHDKYPDAFMRYRPTLPRGRFVDISDTGSRAGFGGTPEEWRLYRNAYRNTLLWNVGAFFDRLFASGALANATLIYTSDHGQNLHEDGGAGLNTHCSPEPKMEEGLVPLVVVEGAGARSLDWGRAVALNRDRASHYAIFPTLLTLMGYDARQVTALYGASLDRPLTHPPAFNARFNARLGKDPVWVEIDVPRPRMAER